MKTISDLINILHLDQINSHTFSGVSATVGSPNVFGGQVLAQALNAANRTIHNHRNLHSMHAYFLEPGNLELPIVYQVEVIRDGGSFSTRRVTAKQENKTIFILSSSFHKEEMGYNHQIEFAKDIPQPENLMSWDDILKQMGDFLPPSVKYFFEIERPIAFKPVQINNPLERVDLKPNLEVWFKFKGEIPKLTRELKYQLLTYVSDYNILTATLHPHASVANYSNTQMASLDHSMWYFRDFDLNDWMLFTIESPNANNARGFAKGNIFTREGKLVASVAQEGLMRPKKA